jgi:para-nitrobenzyl esterase
MLEKVTTKYGVVKGIASEKGFALFKGIPYAAPPVGDLRWKPSVDPSPWQGVKKCDTWGSACPQIIPFVDPDSGYGKEFYASGEYPPVMNEDCLYLNIWTPAKSSDEKLPVMVWMHGGGTQSGYGHEIEFDGDEYCRRGVILVTINYRLNVFGYFAHPELSDESEFKASGNYGVHDQIQALRWIHDNIAAFGGDPENVTGFGQSGGGRSTQAISCSPLAKGLVHRAIVQSAGGISTAAGRLPLKEIEQRGVKFMEYTGCKNIAELRALSADQLLKLLKEYGELASGDISERLMRGFHISTDGHALPLSMEDTLLNGKQSDLSYMLGSNGGDMNSEFLMAVLRGWAHMQQKYDLKPAYMYRFMHSLPETDPNDDRVLKGSFHSADLWYMFGTLGRCWRPMTPADYELSRIMLDYWSNFAKNGNPNGEGLPHWDTYDNDTALLMRLDVGECKMNDFDPDGDVRKIEENILREFAITYILSINPQIRF